MANTRYASRTATFGNVAYDLESLKRNFEFSTYAEPEVYREPEAESVPAPRTRTRERARAAAETGVGVSVFSVLGYAVAAVLLIFVILSYVQITELNASTSELNGQLSELTTEATELRVAYETTFNINEIEEYAESTLGMVRLTNDNVASVSIERSDTGVILSEKEEGESAFTGFVEHLRSLLEYFK